MSSICATWACCFIPRPSATLTRIAGVATIRCCFAPRPSGLLPSTTTDIRARVLEAIKTVRWIPAWGEERISNMVKDRPDWCISRQRDWGVPIVAFYCAGCGEILLEKRIIDHVASIFDQEGADAWYAREATQLLPEGTACRKCGGRDFRKEFEHPGCLVRFGQQPFGDAGA